MAYYRAGYTGLPAARKLGQIYPDKNYISRCSISWRGASSRNSGYLVDTTLNDGFTSIKEMENSKKNDIYSLGMMQLNL